MNLPISRLIEKTLISYAAGYHRKDQLSDFPLHDVAKNLIERQLSSSKAPTLNLQIKPSALEALRAVRDKSMELGVLSSIKWVNAAILSDGNTHRAKLRLKGLLPDHWTSLHRASFKVRMKDGRLCSAMTNFHCTSQVREPFPIATHLTNSLPISIYTAMARVT